MSGGIVRGRVRTRIAAAGRLAGEWGTGSARGMHLGGGERARSAGGMHLGGGERVGPVAFAEMVVITCAAEAKQAIVAQVGGVRLQVLFAYVALLSERTHGGGGGWGGGRGGGGDGGGGDGGGGGN